MSIQSVESTVVPVSNVVAVGAVASPLWLAHVSEIAALVLPIIGVLWLAVQIGFFVYGKWKNARKSD